MNSLEIDAFFHELFGFLGRGFTMDRTRFFFAIVDLACFVRELVADIIAVFLDVLFQLVQRFNIIIERWVLGDIAAFGATSSLPLRIPPRLGAISSSGVGIAAFRTSERA